MRRRHLRKATATPATAAAAAVPTRSLGRVQEDWSVAEGIDALLARLRGMRRVVLHWPGLQPGTRLGGGRLVAGTMAMAGQKCTPETAASWSEIGGGLALKDRPFYPKEQNASGHPPSTIRCTIRPSQKKSCLITSTCPRARSGPQTTPMRAPYFADRWRTTRSCIFCSPARSTLRTPPRGSPGCAGSSMRPPVRPKSRPTSADVS